MKKCNGVGCSEMVDDKYKFCKKHYYEDVKAHSDFKKGGNNFTNPSSNSLPPFDVNRVKDIHFQLCLKVAVSLVSSRKLKGGLDEDLREVIRIARILHKECWNDG